MLRNRLLFLLDEKQGSLQQAHSSSQIPGSEKLPGPAALHPPSSTVVDLPCGSHIIYLQRFVHGTILCASPCACIQLMMVLAAAILRASHGPSCGCSSVLRSGWSYVGDDSFAEWRCVIPNTMAGCLSWSVCCVALSPAAGRDY